MRPSLALPALSLVAAAVATEHAHLNRLLPRQANSTITSSAGPAPSCNINCVALNSLQSWQWNRVTITSNITVATVIYIIDERTNQTRTSTKSNTLPADVTIPPTNAAGTHISWVTLQTAPGQSTTVEVAYPTKYTSYPSSYYWRGTLLTTNSAGQSVCSTIPSGERQWITLAPYPTTQNRPTSTDSADPSGYTHILQEATCWWPVQREVAPNDAAPLLCTSQAFCPVGIIETVGFLTETSISRESSTPDPTPEPSVPAEPITEPNPPASNPPAPPTSNPPAPGNSAPPAPGNSAPPANTAAPPAPGNTAPPANSAPPANTAVPAPNNPTIAPTPNNRAPSPNDPAPSPNNPAPSPSRNNPPAASPTTPGPVLIGTIPGTIDSSSNIVIGTQTLSQGGQIVIAGTTISLAPGGSVAVVNSASVAVVAAPSAPAAPVVTVNNAPVTANSNGEFIVPQSGGSGALTTIGSITTNDAGSTVAVIGGTTSVLQPQPSDSVGDDVAAGIGEIEQSNIASANFASLLLSTYVLAASALLVSLL